jgi:dipeptidyl aminopeptidase/acylaminoacyl peptidase
LIVQPHPGPTSDARIRLELRIQFFTSRGFAVVDVNYRGSTGYGRAYRAHLDGHWGVLDVQDCVDVATFLADRGDADPDRTVITGASAGGFTVLRALATTDRFAAGASWFGIADLATFRTHAPRFQRHHTDHLVGPWPEAAHLYWDRSPVHNADQITHPILVIHGLDDEVVPPSRPRLSSRHSESTPSPSPNSLSPARATACAAPTTSTAHSKPNSPSTGPC